MRPKTSGVYYITHLPTGMTYIGYSSDVSKRLTKHKSRVRSGRYDSRFYRFCRDNPEGWTCGLIEKSPIDPRASEIAALKRVPEALRLNDIHFDFKIRTYKDPKEISNLQRSIQEAKNKNRTGYPGVSEQGGGRGFKYKISWPTGSIREKGFPTAKLAHDARVRRLQELNQGV